MTETKTTEENAALAAADALEVLAQALRAGRVTLDHHEESAATVDGIPSGSIRHVVIVRAVEAQRRAPITARVEGITIGPVLGFGVEPRGGERVELSLRCSATYDEVETLARLANARAARAKGRMVSGSDVGPVGSGG